LSYNLEIKMLPEVELPDEAFAMEGFVAHPGARNRPVRSPAGEPSGRSLAEHGVEANALSPRLAGIESLAGGKESGRGIAIGQAGRAIICAEKRDGIARPIIERVPHQLGAELVVSHFTPDVAVALRTEVVELVDATVSRESEDALLREQIVELELAQLYVKPRAAEEIVETRHDGFKVKRGGIVRRRKHVEREVR